MNDDTDYGKLRSKDGGHGVYIRLLTAGLCYRIWSRRFRVPPKACSATWITNICTCTCQKHFIHTISFQVLDSFHLLMFYYSLHITLFPLFTFSFYLPHSPISSPSLSLPLPPSFCLYHEYLSKSHPMSFQSNMHRSRFHLTYPYNRRKRSIYTILAHQHLIENQKLRIERSRVNTTNKDVERSSRWFQYFIKKHFKDEL